MLVKAVTKKGEAVAYTPAEGIPFAVNYGVKRLSTKDRIYWVHKETIKVLTNPSTVNAKGGWEASATGTMMLGYTDVATDLFYDAKPYSFNIQYKTSKDHLGLPDLEVVLFEATPLSTNPSDLMSFKDSAPPVVKAEAKKEEAKKEEPKAPEKSNEKSK